MRSSRFIGLLAVLGVVVAGGFAWQHRTTAALRAELSLQKGLLAEAGRTKARHAELVARQVPPEEVARRREEREAWVALAAEIKTLRDRTETKKAGQESNPAPAKPRSLKHLP